MKLHTKEEPYIDYKYFRGIYARTDAFKVVIGAIISVMEDVLFKMPWFIKKVPVCDRPRVIAEMLIPGFVAWATDYTSFESLFQEQIMKNTEFKLYHHMLGDACPSLLRFMIFTLAGMNAIHHKNLQCKIKACRMSGEMNTSLANTFSNLMFALFYLYSIHVDPGPGKYEGDDGLQMVPEGTPEPTTFFSDMGLRLKIEVHSSLTTASFCGVVTDIVDLVNLTDPRKAMASFGWGSMCYVGSRSATRMKLLRCKAFSMAYQYRGCPILDQLAHAALKFTRSYDISDFVTHLKIEPHKLEILMAALAKAPEIVKAGPLTPTANSRKVIVEVYGITEDVQINLENHYMTTKNPVLDSKYDDGIFPGVWVHCAAHYVIQSRQKDCVTTGLRANAEDLDHVLDVVQSCSRSTVRIA